MNLGEFHDDVRASLGRGTSLDALIPSWTRRAALWIERNRTLQYMRKYAVVEIDIETNDTPRFIEIEGAGFKAVEMLRWITADGEYHAVTPKDPRDFPRLETGTPIYYWLDGVSRIVLASTPNENLSGELVVATYTSWPGQLTAQHWLLDAAFDVLFARTMMNYARHARDAGAYQTYKTELDDALLGLYAADDELIYSGADLAMNYSGG